VVVAGGFGPVEHVFDPQPSDLTAPALAPKRDAAGGKRERADPETIPDLTPWLCRAGVERLVRAAREVA
jgi:hypothetical protein